MPKARKRVIGEGKILSKVPISEDLVFVSGSGPHDPKTGNRLRGNTRVDKEGMDPLRVTLEEAGCSLGDVLECTLYLSVRTSK